MTQTKVEAPFVENNSPFRNLIINGDMKIAQRATSATTITNNSVHYATVDRFAVYEYSGAVLTSEQHDMSAADQATTGQSKAMELNVTTADTSIASGEWCFFTQPVEAQFCQHALYGTSAAKNLTLSFWVKTNKTGTYAVAIDKNDSTRYRLPITYTVDSADTWEKKVINISPTAGSTSLITAANGAIADDNGLGFFIWWVLAAGTDSQGTNNTWTSSGHYTTSDQVNWLDSTDNNFHITGVQLEVGDQATDFEYLPFDVQFQRCQRYLQCITHNATTSGNVTGDNKYIMDVHFYNGTACYGSYMFPVQMRGTPTVVATDTSNAMRVYYKGTYDSIDNLSLEGTARFNHILIGNFTDIAENSQSGAAGHIYNYDNAQVFVDAEL
tara:strand:+ start:824 stop:1975 length:1152 start_codon:yes stop_codon:yes gene_type:complete